MIDATVLQSLVEAYGADPRRWPADRRTAAEAFVAAEPGQAAAILALEASLDDALDVLRPPVASADLRQRILAAAPRPRDEGWSGLVNWLRPSVGAAMAASCIAGACAGLLLVHPSTRGDAGGQDLWSVVSPSSDTAAVDDDNGLS